MDSMDTVRFKSQSTQFYSQHIFEFRTILTNDTFSPQAWSVLCEVQTESLKTVYIIFYFNTCTVHISLFLLHQQMHNYLIYYISQQSLCVIYTATCFDTVMSPSDSLQSMPC